MRVSFEWSRIVTPALVAVLAAGCGGEGGGDGAAGDGEGADAPEMAFPVPEGEQGSVSGVVNFTGTPPAPETVDMSAEPTCAEQYEGQPTRPAAVVNDGRLGQVFVHVTEGLPADMQFPTPSEAVVLDQEGCRYDPHVLGIQTGQTLEIHNSDGILHNINANPDVNRGFNISQPVEMTSDRQFGQAEVMIPVRCDVHGWMEAYIGVQEHPYFAVSADDGTFTIDRLPAGEYTLEAWHERYGTQTAQVTVDAGGTAEISFDFAESMAETAVVPLGEPIDLHDHGSAPVAASEGATGPAGDTR